MKTFIQKLDGDITLMAQGKCILKYHQQYLGHDETDIECLCTIAKDGRVFIDRYWLTHNKNLAKTVAKFLRDYVYLWFKTYPKIYNRPDYYKSFDFTNDFYNYVA